MRRLFAEIRDELKPMAQLAWPLVVGELGWMFMGVVDTVMVGRLPDSAAAIGAVSLATIIYYSMAMTLGCVLLGLDTLVSQAYGAGKMADCHRSLWNGLYIAAAITPIAAGIAWVTAHSLARMGVKAAVVPAAASYMTILICGSPALFVFFALRRYLQGIGAVGVVGVCLMSVNIINGVGNWALIYGHLGLPAMGLNGSAWATVTSSYFMSAVLIGYTLWVERSAHHSIFDVSVLPDWARIRSLLRLGIPASAHVGVETLLFTVVTLLISRISAEALAAHQIALTLASLTYMVPLGISSAAAVRVGHRIGAGDVEGAARSGYAAIAIGAAFMCCSAIVFFVVPEKIASLYTSDAGVIRISVVLLAAAAVFQIFDGIQITTSGALRGLGDTHTALICHLIFYWAVGLPAGYWLCFGLGYGPAGLWAGLSVALILIGCVLLVCWRRKVGRLQVAPLDIELSQAG